jgi:hypothetical protein
MSLPSRCAALLPLGLITLPPSGCCDLAGLLCGPDRSRWVPVSYDTPGEALATFLEAVRRDQARILCEALSEDFRQRLGLPGCLEGALAWDKLRDRMPGVHLLGAAEPAAPFAVTPSRSCYLLEVAGRELVVVLRRYAFVGVRYTVDGVLEPQERYVESLADFVLLGGEELDRTVDLRIGELDLPNDLRGEDIAAVVASHYWKVDDLLEVTDEAAP